MKDSLYWNSFYNNNNLSLEPSSFCLFVKEFIKDKSNLKILDCGCGSGRDSYLLSESHFVTGVDSSGVLPQNTPTCNFITDNFCSIDKNDYDVIYSRFSFHSITNQDQSEFISSITKKDTILCMEFRSDKDKDNERIFGDDHYRNFVNINYLKQLLEDNKFYIFYLKESTGFAPYKEENPVCIRTITIKK